MHPTVMARRAQEATAQASAAAEGLAAIFGVEPKAAEATSRSLPRDPQVQAMARMEALAETLGRVLEAAQADRAARQAAPEKGKGKP